MPETDKEKLRNLAGGTEFKYVDKGQNPPLIVTAIKGKIVFDNKTDEILIEVRGNNKGEADFLNPEMLVKRTYQPRPFTRRRKG